MLGLSCVTMGDEVSELAAKLFADNAYQEYLYVHGMGVEAGGPGRAVAQRMREELGIDGGDSPHVRDLFTQTYRGSRYSFGYPACPDMSHQEILFRLLSRNESMPSDRELADRSRAEHVGDHHAPSRGQVLRRLADGSGVVARGGARPAAQHLTATCAPMPAAMANWLDPPASRPATWRSASMR